MHRSKHGSRWERIVINDTFIDFKLVPSSCDLTFAFRFVVHRTVEQNGGELDNKFQLESFSGDAKAWFVQWKVKQQEWECAKRLSVDDVACGLRIRQMHNWLSQNWLDDIYDEWTWQYCRARWSLIKFQLYSGENFERWWNVLKWIDENCIDSLCYLISRTLNHWDNPVTHCCYSDKDIRQSITTRHGSPTRDTNHSPVNNEWCPWVTRTNRSSRSTENAQFLIDYKFPSVRDAVHVSALFIWNCSEVHSLKQVSSSWHKPVTVSSPSSKNSFNTSRNEIGRQGYWLDEVAINDSCRCPNDCNVIKHRSRNIARMNKCS